MPDSRPTQSTRASTSDTRSHRALAALALAAVWATGLSLGLVTSGPAQLAAQSHDEDLYTSLRVYGYPVVSNPAENPFGNGPATAGSLTALDPNTGRIPEDPPYTDPAGPFDPLSAEAPRMDFVTWDPAWISERLADRDLMRMWPGLRGMDEVSRGSHIRAGNVDGSEKVWLRHWYEPQHLDKDLNADGRLTDADNSGNPDAPVNPEPSNIDEWYPAVVTELTYMLVDNDPLPLRNPRPSELHRSAPRPACGTAGGTSMVLPVGVFADQLDPGGAPIGHGLTSLDFDFDGRIDMVNVTHEAALPEVIDGTRIDFDGDGVLDTFDTNGQPLDCDEMAVFHTDATVIGLGQTLQFMDFFIKLDAVTDSSAVLEVWRNASLVPQRIQRRSVGVGGAMLVGEGGPVQVLPPGGTNLGEVPVGPWFAHVRDADVADKTAVLVVGRALGAPCASMESAPNVPNKSPGGPWFLKRLYVDGHEYNVVAIGTCDSQRFQYITIRTPLPKVPVTIEQHSVQLQAYPLLDLRELPRLPLPPPFNYEHTIVEDVRALDAFDPLVPPPDRPLPLPRPNVIYMGGPIGPVPPVLNADDSVPYVGRGPHDPVGPYEDERALYWRYIREEVNELMLGQLQEKYGAAPDGDAQPDPGQPSFFYNEQIWTLPWHYTEFLLPDLPEDPDPRPRYDADKYLLTSQFVAPTMRWRRWAMPDGPVPAAVPPVPPDLVVDHTPDGGDLMGASRRAAFWFDPSDPPEEPVKLWLDKSGVRVYGGQPQRADRPCDARDTALAFGAGDTRVSADPLDPGYPVEVYPYTDPWAPFNPQHAHAPRSDSLTTNPAYMDEFRNFNEPLRALYRQLSNDARNAREKVSHRLWYEPEYVSKVRFADDCRGDFSFPAVMQEYTFLYVDTTDNPAAAPPGRSRFGFPIGTRADELPVPSPGGMLPGGGEFGYGLTTFDANFDRVPDAVTVHSEQTLHAFLDTQWRSNRPDLPGFEPPELPGPRLDFDGDGVDDTLDEDDVPLNGNEMVVFAVEDVTLDLDARTPEGSSAMVLDHLVTLENVTRGSRAQVSFWFTGGGSSAARPTRINGVYSLRIGDAALVDRFQDGVTIVVPGDVNTSTDGAWFVFLQDVATSDDRVTVTVGRALGASHSAIDDGAGAHDMLPGDPWYLKRFYVDGHEYNVVAIMTRHADSVGGAQFEFITIRTPVPKGNAYNPEDSLLLQGYYVGDLPDTLSVMPPFNVDHTMAEDIARMDEAEFANTREYDGCLGRLRPFGALEETVADEDVERRYGSELLEIFDRRDTGFGWQTDQTIVIPNQYTDLVVSDGQRYLLTSNWRSTVSRLAFYGCLRTPGAPAPVYEPDLTHEELAFIADAWNPPAPPDIVPAPNQLNPPQPVPPPYIPPGEPDVYADFFDSRLGPPTMRVKQFYDPSERMVDIYINRRPIPPDDATPTPTSGPSPTSTSTATDGPSPTASSTPTRGPSPTSTSTATDGPSPTSTSTATDGPSPTSTSTATDGPSPTSTSTATDGPSPTSTSTATDGPSPTSTSTATDGPSPTSTSTATDGPSPTSTSTATDGPSPTSTSTATDGPSPTSTSTATDGPSPTSTSTATDGPSPTSTSTATDGPSPTSTSTATDGPSPTSTSTATDGPSPTSTSTATDGPSPTSTSTATDGPSPTSTSTATDGPSPTSTSTATDGPSPTSTSTATDGPSPTSTSTATDGPSPTSTGTATDGPSPTSTSTATDGPSPTSTSTATDGPSPTSTSTATDGPSPTSTSTATDGPSPTASRTPTDGPSPTASNTPTRGPSPTASRTPTDGPSPTASSTRRPTSTATPRPPNFRPVCVLVDEDPLLLKWVDATRFESEFQLQVRVNGSVWMPYDPPVRSTTMRSTGTMYSVLTGALPMNSVYMFRVRSHNRDTGETSPWSRASSECYTPQMPDHRVGCYEGQVYMQGRSDHSDALVYFHGFPVTQADTSGNFRFCGALPGQHRISSRGACYLESRAPAVYVGPGRTTTLPFTALRGGDVNNDAWVNLYDLVRVGAAYNTAPPADPEADCNKDDRIDLFDLVMVSSNYGVRGPVPWADPWAAAGAAQDDGSIINPMALAVAMQGVVDGTPVLLPSRVQNGDELVVDVVVRGAVDLYGAELVLAYDTERLAAIDADPAREGVQVALGPVWPDESFVARNNADTDQGEIRFAISLMRPATALEGDLLVLQIAFRMLGEGPHHEAYRLTNVQLADHTGRPIGTRWSGVEIHRVADLLLPIVKVHRVVR